MAVPTGFARSLERALGLESVRLDQPTRVSGTSKLLNPRRLEIVLTAAVYPGIHLRSASRLLLSPLPSLRFHVGRLETAGLLRTRRLGRKVLLFLPDQYPSGAEPFLAAWEDPFDRRILQMIRDHAGISHEALARQIVPDSKVLQRALSRLQEADAIRARGSKSDPRFDMTAAWRRFERLCRDGMSDRLQKFLALLDAEGLRPMLEEMTVDRARLSVDGPRARVRFAYPLNPLTRDAAHAEIP